MTVNANLVGLITEKENLEQVADFILSGYFGSLKKLLNIAVNSEPRKANAEEIEDYNSYMDTVKRIGEINQKLKVIWMTRKGVSNAEISKTMGYKPDYDFDGLLTKPD